MENKEKKMERKRKNINIYLIKKFFRVSGSQKVQADNYVP